MKKTISILLTVLLVTLSCAALAQTTTEATALPGGVTFGMTLKETADALGKDASMEPDETDDEVGAIYVDTLENAIGSLTAYDISFDVDRNNSAREPRMSLAFCSLPAGDNVIASFRDALAAFTAVYGEPDGDPFDQSGVEGYVEYGYLSATWTKADARINLEMSRAFSDRLDASFTYRLNYDEADLK